MTTRAPNDEPHALHQPPPSGRRPKRRWWIYLAVGLGATFVIGVVIVTGIVIYWRSLVRDYTTTQSQPLSVVKVTDADLAAFHARWLPFQEAVVNGTAAKPFEASAADLNLLIAQNAGLKDRLRVIITNNQVFGQFTFPLDQTKQPALKGRYLNGLARLNFDLQDGWLTVNVAELQANGKPVPRWILKKVQKENLAKGLDKSQEAVTFIQQLDAIEVEDDLIVLKPPAKN